jgi:DNA-binding CsgD family transcriptional regulator
MNKPGTFTRRIFRNIPVQTDSTDYSKLKNTMTSYLFVYDFTSNKLLFEAGWKELLQLSATPTIHAIFDRIQSKFQLQVMEILDCLLEQMLSNREEVIKYGCTIEFKLKSENGPLIPVVFRIGVYEVGDMGEALSCIIRCQRDDALRIGGIARYTIYAPSEGCSRHLNQKFSVVSQLGQDELQILRLIARGMAFKEVAHQMSISKSSVEKRVQRMYKRFNVKSAAHLVGHAYDHFILP